MGTGIKRQRDSPGVGKCQGPFGGVGGRYLKGLQEMPVFLREMFITGTISESTTLLIVLFSLFKGKKNMRKTKLNTYTRKRATHIIPWVYV